MSARHQGKQAIVSDSKVDTNTGEDLAGKVLLGEYRIEKKLGAGGMSHVYLAHQLSVDRPVVVKVMIPPSVDVERWKGRFMREARAASKIRHRGVVTIYSFGEEEGVGPFIAMEYVEGRSLRDVIREEAPLEPSRAARIVAQACRALHAAHDMGVIHRDLKPDNLMVQVEDGREQTRVLDFGVAKAPDTLVDTLDGHVVGTPAYMAPEQARNQEVDARADVYSMAIILFELIDGARPFDAPTPVAMMLKHVQEPLPLERLEGVDEGLLDVLSQAAEKAPNARWASAEAFAEALEQLDAVEVVPVTPGELGAVSTDDVEQAPHTPAAVPTLAGPVPAAEEAPAPVAPSQESARPVAVETDDGGARMAMVVSLGALALAVVAVAAVVATTVFDGSDSKGAEERKEVVIEVLDAGVGPRVAVEAEDAPTDEPVADAVDRAGVGIFGARARAMGSADAAGEALPKPGAALHRKGAEGQTGSARKTDDDLEFEMVEDPNRDKNKLMSPTFSE
jgi:tRNA A-37 threonylcarbamoyl transferase component Bud32